MYYQDDYHYYCEDCGREISQEEFQENYGLCDICFDYYQEQSALDNE